MELTIDCKVISGFDLLPIAKRFTVYNFPFVGEINKLNGGFGLVSLRGFWKRRLTGGG